MSAESARALADAAARAGRFLETLPGRPVKARRSMAELLAELGGALPSQPTEVSQVLKLLDESASAGVVASAGPRYFGFVTGGSLPAALGAAVLAAAWDQNAALEVMSPAAAALEEAAARWTLSLLGLPSGSAVGFTTGATMANVTGLAAARHALLERRGWDIGERGFQGAPALPVIVGEEVHVSVLKALALLGFGRAGLQRVSVDGQGRMRPEAFPVLKEPAIVCVQAGNVNTGAFDPLRELCARAHAGGAWVHVDGAFGLWARASAPYRALADGAELADSWATDAHKWLNVPYDSGLAIVRDAAALRKAMSHSAAYLAQGELRDGASLVPEFSRRARGIEVWAALRSLGSEGVADLVARCCRLALRFADGMRASGFAVLNEVVLNQVMVSFGPAERTERVVAALQQEGTCWCGATTWQNHRAMRFSVSSWATTEADIDRSVDAVVRVAKANSGSGS